MEREREAVARAAQRATEAAQAKQRAEAGRQTEAARLAEAQRLAQAVAAAEATAAREVQARQAAEAAAKSAEAEQRAQAERRAEAERNAEAARQVEAAQRAEAQRLAQALAAAKAAAAREVQARQGAESALAQAASVRRIAEAQQRAQERLALTATAKSLPEPGVATAAAGVLVAAAANVRQARTGLLWGAALLAAAIAAVQWWSTRSPSPATPVAPPPVTNAPASPPEPTAEPAPANVGRYDMLVAASDRSRARIARELAGALSTDGNAMQLVPLPGGAGPIAGLQSPGRLAIARLDALRAARASAAPPLRVLAPLFPEAVLFIVRADSRLKYIHDLGGRRLSIGPVQSDGSHTVREIYRRLLGAEMAEPVQLDNDQALAELVAFRSIDAMAIIEPQPSAWWASLDPGIASRLRLLTLDPRHPADRRLLQTLGTPVARIGAGATKGKLTTTPAVLSYLVASGEGDADVDRLTAMARALCRELPRLRKQGDPKWRELQPMAQLDTGWPVVRPFQSTLSRCARR
jgi:hypothetical protein